MTEYFIAGFGIVQSRQAFTLPDGRKFNAGWLDGASAEDRASINAVPVIRQEKPAYDPRVARLVEAKDGATITYAVEPRPQAEIDAALAAVTAAADADIDRAAEATRLKFVTAGSAQAMVYRAKNEEVDRFVAAGEPGSPAAVDYPWAAARAQRLGATIAAVLGDWKQRIDGWQEIGIAIEDIREGAKEAVVAAALAGDFGAIEAARDTATAAFADLLAAQA